jgi:hypothetical protein
VGNYEIPESVRDQIPVLSGEDVFDMCLTDEDREFLASIKVRVEHGA